MRNALRVCLAVAVLLTAAAAYADKRPHEGKVTRVDPVARVIQVQSEHGDTWTLNVSETAKMKHNVTLEELQPGDAVHFDYVEKDGQMWVTELRRTHKAKD
jgi:Cu/Ag efflux protein CusF